MITKVIDLGSIRVDEKALFVSATIDSVDNYLKLSHRIPMGGGKNEYRLRRMREDLVRLRNQAIGMRDQIDSGDDPSWTQVAEFRAEVVKAGEKALEFLFMLNDWPENKWCHTCGEYAHLGWPREKHEGHTVDQ